MTTNTNEIAASNWDTVPVTQWATDNLEDELKTLSARIANDPIRFRQVSDELARRRREQDEQPPMTVTTTDSQKKRDADLNNNLVLKIIAMEAEQAKLVLEAEAAKAAQREAEERLALIARKLSDVIRRTDAREAPEFEGGIETAE